MKHIQKVVVFDGEKTYQFEEVLNHPVFKNYYRAANSLYQMVVDDINEHPTAYLYIDATEKPTFDIMDRDEQLSEKLRKANLM